MILLFLDPVFMALFLILVAVPGYYFNRFLLKYIEPRKSIARFLIYIIAALLVAFGYTALMSFFLVRVVFSRN